MSLHGRVVALGPQHRLALQSTHWHAILKMHHELSLSLFTSEIYIASEAASSSGINTSTCYLPKETNCGNKGQSLFEQIN